jgi:hypothetical protein
VIVKVVSLKEPSWTLPKPSEATLGLHAGGFTVALSPWPPQDPDGKIRANSPAQLTSLRR